MEYKLINPIIPQYTPIEQVLTNRGIPFNIIENYLKPTIDNVYDPLLLKNLDKGLKMLIRHIGQKSKIFIQIDSDCDGYTSAALLLNYLYCHFPGFVLNNITYGVHDGKLHGLILDNIPADVKLVIVPDASSNDFDVHQELSEKGIDVLVIDHHQVDKESEYACIINNQICDYPTKSLCGVAMVYKFCCYMDMITQSDYADQFLDLVAIGLVADMMSLKDIETRYLVNEGFKHPRNPFVREIMRRNDFNIKGVLTPHSIGWYISPFINATARVGTVDEKLTLFESMLDFKGYEEISSTKRGCKGQEETRVEQACRNCINIKNKQDRARDASLSIIEQIIEEKNLLENKVLIIKNDNVLPKDDIKNITGLICNKLTPIVNRPVLLLHKVVRVDEITKEEIVSWEGSGRGYPQSGAIPSFRDFLMESNFVEYAEGHHNAFGTKVLDINFIPLINYINNKLIDCDFNNFHYDVDFIFDGNNVDPKIIETLGDMDYLWGQEVEQPIVAIKDLVITKNNIWLQGQNQNSFKITLPNGICLVKFKSSKEEYEQLYSELGCVIIDIVGTCNLNQYRGNITPQIFIEDYEVVGKQEFYF